MAVFFIDTGTGQIATKRQLVESGLVRPDRDPERPWHRIQGTDDATTMWYAVLRKQTRGVFIGALTLRHGAHHASLLEQGWEEVPPAAIGTSASRPDSRSDGEARPPVST